MGKTISSCLIIKKSKMEYNTIKEKIISYLKLFKKKLIGDDVNKLHDSVYSIIKKEEFLTDEEMEPISQDIWKRILGR